MNPVEFIKIAGAIGGIAKTGMELLKNARDADQRKLKYEKTSLENQRLRNVLDFESRSGLFGEDATTRKATADTLGDYAGIAKNVLDITTPLVSYGLSALEPVRARAYEAPSDRKGSDALYEGNGLLDAHMEKTRAIRSNFIKPSVSVATRMLTKPVLPDIPQIDVRADLDFDVLSLHLGPGMAHLLTQLVAYGHQYEKLVTKSRQTDGLGATSNTSFFSDEADVGGVRAPAIQGPGSSLRLTSTLRGHLEEVKRKFPSLFYSVASVGVGRTTGRKVLHVRNVISQCMSDHAIFGRFVEHMLIKRGYGLLRDSFDEHVDASHIRSSLKFFNQLLDEVDGLEVECDRFLNEGNLSNRDVIIYDLLRHVHERVHYTAQTDDAMLVGKDAGVVVNVSNCVRNTFVLAWSSFMRPAFFNGISDGEWVAYEDFAALNEYENESESINTIGRVLTRGFTALTNTVKNLGINPALTDLFEAVKVLFSDTSKFGFDVFNKLQNEAYNSNNYISSTFYRYCEFMRSTYVGNGILIIMLLVPILAKLYGRYKSEKAATEDGDGDEVDALLGMSEELITDGYNEARLETLRRFLHNSWNWLKPVITDPNLIALSYWIMKSFFAENILSIFDDEDVANQAITWIDYAVVLGATARTGGVASDVVKGIVKNTVFSPEVIEEGIERARIGVELVQLGASHSGKDAWKFLLPEYLVKKSGRSYGPFGNLEVELELKRNTDYDVINEGEWMQSTAFKTDASYDLLQDEPVIPLADGDETSKIIAVDVIGHLIYSTRGDNQYGVHLDKCFEDALPSIALCIDDVESMFRHELADAIDIAKRSATTDLPIVLNDVFAGVTRQFQSVYFREFIAIAFPNRYQNEKFEAEKKMLLSETRAETDNGLRLLEAHHETMTAMLNSNDGVGRWTSLLHVGTLITDTVDCLSRLSLGLHDLAGSETGVLNAVTVLKSIEEMERRISTYSKIVAENGIFGLFISVVVGGTSVAFLEAAAKSVSKRDSQGGVAANENYLRYISRLLLDEINGISENDIKMAIDDIREHLEDEVPTSTGVYGRLKGSLVKMTKALMGIGNTADLTKQKALRSRFADFTDALVTELFKFNVSKSIVRSKLRNVLGILGFFGADMTTYVGSYVASELDEKAEALEAGNENPPLCASDMPLVNFRHSLVDRINQGLQNCTEALVLAKDRCLASIMNVFVPGLRHPHTKTVREFAEVFLRGHDVRAWLRLPYVQADLASWDSMSGVDISERYFHELAVSVGFDLEKGLEAFVVYALPEIKIADLAGNGGAMVGRMLENRDLMSAMRTVSGTWTPVRERPQALISESSHFEWVRERFVGEDASVSKVFGRDYLFKNLVYYSEEAMALAAEKIDKTSLRIKCLFCVRAIEKMKAQAMIIQNRIMDQHIKEMLEAEVPALNSPHVRMKIAELIDLQMDREVISDPRNARVQHRLSQTRANMLKRVRVETELGEIS